MQDLKKKKIIINQSTTATRIISFLRAHIANSHIPRFLLDSAHQCVFAPAVWSHGVDNLRARAQRVQELYNVAHKRTN